MARGNQRGGDTPEIDAELDPVESLVQQIGCWIEKRTGIHPEQTELAITSTALTTEERSALIEAINQLDREGAGNELAERVGRELAPLFPGVVEIWPPAEADTGEIVTEILPAVEALVDALRRACSGETSSDDVLLVEVRQSHLENVLESFRVSELMPRRA